MRTAKEWARPLATEMIGTLDRGMLRTISLVELFALVQADAIESAAKVCEAKERTVRTRNCDSYTEGFADGCASCEVTIRALLPKPPTTTETTTP